MLRIRFALTLALLLPSAVLPAVAQQLTDAVPAALRYPSTRKGDTIANYHGNAIADPCRWMEAIESPEMAEWVKAQNVITLPYLAALPGRDILKARITALYNYPRSDVPWWEGGRWFYSKNSGLQRQNVWYMRQTLDGPDQLVIDPNQLSPDGGVALSGFAPSPDGKSLAYGLSEGGSDWVTYHVRELATGKDTADEVRWAKFSGLSWTKDGNGFFYSRYPEPPKGEELTVKLEHHTLYYHRLGTPQSQDLKIYARPEHPSWFVWGGLDETGRYVFVSTSQGTDKNELFLADLGDPQRPNLAAPIRDVVTGHDANYWPMGVVNGKLYMQTDNDAPNRKLVVTSVTSPERANWTTLLAEGEMPLEYASLVAGRIASLSLQDVTPIVRLYTLDGRLEREVEMPGFGSASGLIGRFDRSELFYAFNSPLMPSSVFIYDAATNSSRPFNQPKLTFDPLQFLTERALFNSEDGTRVPMFITRRRDLVKDGGNPTMLHAYGGFSVTMTPSFNPSVIAWIELGGVYALANIRGGGEYGERWHKAGMLEKKQNVFDDFIAGAEYLIHEKYTSSSRLAIEGDSNGGLLVGAAMTQRPELFAVAVPQVGVMDMLRYDEFTGGAAWAVEYGSAKDAAAFKHLRAYSPIHNVKSDVCYPATLVTTADHDDRVVPSHSYKFTATLQPVQAAVSGCNRPVLIRVEAQASHGYRPLDRRIAESADIWAFVAHHTGSKVRAVPTTGHSSATSR